MDTHQANKFIAVSMKTLMSGTHRKIRSDIVAAETAKIYGIPVMGECEEYIIIQYESPLYSLLNDSLYEYHCKIESIKKEKFPYGVPSLLYHHDSALNSDIKTNLLDQKCTACVACGVVYLPQKKEITNIRVKKDLCTRREYKFNDILKVSEEARRMVAKRCIEENLFFDSKLIKYDLVKSYTMFSMHALFPTYGE